MSARLPLADELLALFNGGLVDVPSLNNPRGFTTMYRPEQAMRKVVDALKPALQQAAVNPMRDALEMILLAAISGDASKQQIASMARDALAAERVQP